MKLSIFILAVFMISIHSAQAGSYAPCEPVKSAIASACTSGSADKSMAEKVGSDCLAWAPKLDEHDRTFGLLREKCQNPSGEVLKACGIDLRGLGTAYKEISLEIAKLVKDTRGTRKCSSEAERLYGFIKARAEESERLTKEKLDSLPPLPAIAK